MSWTVIIPSRDDEKVIGCVASLVHSQPEIEPGQIVIVSDGLSLRTRWRLRGVRWVTGETPFIFARAVNAGARAADPNSDLVIMGDDVRLSTPCALDLLAAVSEGMAAVAPEVSGVCGQASQRTGSGVDTAEWIAFICAYIPRAAWNEVGPLDECFTGYGYDDVDWCIRARKAGQIKVAHDVHVTHIHESSYRSRDDWLLRYEQNRIVFEQKWRQEIA